MRGAVFDERWLSDHPGANFLSATIHEEVRRRLETRQGQETVDVDRLERHLLSSMPLCFNLFGELPTQPDRLSAFGERLLGTPTTGQAVCFEWSPGRGALEFTNDRTAFDVALSFDTAGGPQLVGIETKYHEVAEAEEPPNPQTRMPRYREIVAAGLDGRPVFEPDWEQRILGSPLQQLWRDHLLLLTAVQSASTPWTGGKYVLVHPAGNPSFADAAEEYADALVDDSTFATMTVEEVLDAGVLTPETEARFRARYLW